MSRFAKLKEQLKREPSRTNVSRRPMGSAKIKALTGVDRDSEVESDLLEDEIKGETDEAKLKKLRQMRHLNQN